MKKKATFFKLRTTAQLSPADRQRVEAAQTLMARTDSHFFEAAKKNLALIPLTATHQSILAGPSRTQKALLPPYSRGGAKSR